MSGKVLESQQKFEKKTCLAFWFSSNSPFIFKNCFHSFTSVRVLSLSAATWRTNLPKFLVAPSREIQNNHSKFEKVENEQSANTKYFDPFDYKVPKRH